MLLLLQWDLKCAIVYTREVICCKHVKWDISTIYDKLLLHAGLFLTYLALFLMDGHGQPALLYLVPCTLGKYGHCSLDFVIIMVSFTLRTAVIVIDALSFHVPGLIVILGWVRGDLHDLWNYGKGRTENVVDEPWEVKFWLMIPECWWHPYYSIDGVSEMYRITLVEKFLRVFSFL